MELNTAAVTCLHKEFGKTIYSRFTKAIEEYELVKEGDKIAVCISGGKDSMLLAVLFNDWVKRSKVRFEVKFLVMDPGYSPANRAMIESNARMLGVPITVFETDIFGSVVNVKNNPCFLCSKMRRGHLYNKARELGCNKIALGHHYDDVIESILMGMIYGGQVQTMLPKLHSANFEGMQLIRPLYLVREESIKRWRDQNGLKFLLCACRFTEQHESGEADSKRAEIKSLIAELAKRNPQIESNIFRSVENVRLDRIISYKE
ncbi:MAG: ATP-binding protein, partial [Oscillospiraceae bacterium]